MAYDPTLNPWWWNPRQDAATPAPDWFRRQLHSIDPDIEVVWNRVRQRWQVWFKTARIQNKFVQGWNLLFIHHDAEGNYLPLDERLFARLHACSARANGPAKKYFNRIMDEHERDAEKREQRLSQEAVDRAMPQFDYSKIKVSGCGPSNGSKFSEFFA